MSRLGRPLPLWIALMVGTLLLAGCAAPVVVRLELNPDSATLRPGETVRFTASLSGGSAALIWSASGGTLYDKDDHATFVAPPAAGDYEVTVVSAADPSLSRTATVTVEPAPFEARIVFVSDRSPILTESGDTAALEVEVLGSDGQPIAGGQVVWSSDDAATVSVAAAGDRSAVVTAESSTAGFATVTASFDGLEASAPVLIATPSAGTVVISSALVLDAAPGSVTLVRNATTEALTAGQRLVSGDRAGLLVELTEVTLSPDSVTAATTPTTLVAAFDALEVTSTATSPEVSAALIDGRTAVVTYRTASGVTAQTIVDDVLCRASNDAEVDLGLSSAGVTLTFSPYAEAAIDIDASLDVIDFRVETGGTVAVSASAGHASFASPVGGVVTCSLELPALPGPSLPLAMFSLSLRPVPILGVEFEAATAVSSFEVSGPEGGVSATVAAGIVYTSASGWDTIAEADADSDFEPFAASAEFDDPFRALVRPFGQIDVALAVDLGLLFFDLTLVDVRFVEFRGFGLLDFELPTLTDEGDLAYLGPDWILGAGVSGSLKVELGGALASFLDFLGIDTVFVDPSRVASQQQTSALFQEFEQLEVSPSITMIAAPGSVEEGETVTLIAASSGDEAGSVEFLAGRDGGALVPIASAPMSGGSAETDWTPGEGAAGEYEIVARLRSDLASEDKPYGSNITVVVVEEPEPDPDPPPGGGEGFMGRNNPWQGSILWASFGDCNATGFLVTVEFDESESGVLTGTLSGREWDGDPDTIDNDFTGPISASVSGQRSDGALSFSLSGGLKGSFSGSLQINGASDLWQFQGTFGNGDVCVDQFGPVDSGLALLIGSVAASDQ